jgi:hypothetical protein
MTEAEWGYIITELDLLYGEDVPWYGFERIHPPTMPEKGNIEATWLTYRRGVKGTPFLPFNSLLFICFIPSSAQSAASPFLPFRKFQDPANRRPSLLGISRHMS